MELEKILKLVEAGFSKTEIMALLNPAQEQAAETVPAPTSEPVPVPEAEQKPAPVQAPVDNSAVLLDAINKLTNTIQSQAIRQSNLPGVTQAQTAEQVLAEIIHPTFSNGGNGN